MTEIEVRRRLCAAQTKKKCVFRDDGERRAKWLEELAVERLSLIHI